MTNDNKQDQKEGAALWAAAREAWRQTELGSLRMQAENLDPLVVAAYLDGALEGEELEAVEVVLARNPALLEEVLGLSLLEPEAPPVSLILRAQGLVRAPATPAARSENSSSRWFDPSRWMQPAAWASATAAVVLAWGLAFELGFSGLEAAAAMDELAARDFLIAPASDETLL